MPGVESLVAILHASAAVGAFGAAYAGFDRGSIGQQATAAEFQAAKKVAKDLMQSLGLENHRAHNVMASKKWRRITILYPASVICIVADDPLRVTWWHKLLQCLYRQIHIPCYRYFRRHGHKLVAGLISLFAFTIFFIVTGMMIWDETAPTNYVLIHWLFYILVSCAIFLLLQGLLSAVISEARAIRHCHLLYGVVQERLVGLLADAEDTIKEFGSNDQNPPASST